MLVILTLSKVEWGKTSAFAVAVVVVFAVALAVAVRQFSSNPTKKSSFRPEPFAPLRTAQRRNPLLRLPLQPPPTSADKA
jgi:hypothetical protein